MYSHAFFTSIAIIVTIIGLSNDLIFYYFQLSIDDLYESAQYIFLGRHVSGHSTFDPATGIVRLSDFLFVLFRQLIITVNDVKDIYLDFFLISGILPLWLISLEFRKVVIQEEKYSSLLKPNFNLVFRRERNWRQHGQLSILKRYGSVCNLARLYTKGYGDVLFCFIFNYLMHCSTSIDSLTRKATTGKRIYELEFISAFAVVYGLGAHLSYEVLHSNLKINGIPFVACYQIIYMHYHTLDYLCIIFVDVISKKIGKLEKPFCKINF